MPVRMTVKPFALYRVTESYFTGQQPQTRK